MQKIKVVDLDSWFNEKNEKDDIEPAEENKCYIEYHADGRVYMTDECVYEPAEENTEYITLYADGKPIGRHYVIDKEE